MKIGVIGTGRMSSHLGKAWAAKGHQVMFGSREPDKAKQLAASMKNASGGSMQEAAAFGEVVLLGVPWNASIETVQKLGSLAGKTLIDITNPVGEGMQLAIGFTTSSAEDIARAAKGAHVVKAFSTVSMMALENPLYSGKPADVLYSGDDAAAKAQVKQLIVDVGLEPVDVGPLKNARLIEAVGNLWIQMAYSLGMGPEFIFKITRR